MKKIDKESLFIIIFIIIGGALTTISFLGYYALDFSNRCMILLYVLDIAYLYLNSALFFYLILGKYPWLKAIVLTTAYFVAFNLIVFVFLLLNNGYGLFLEIWDKILVWSIFIGPCFILIILIFCLLLVGYAEK